MSRRSPRRRGSTPTLGRCRCARSCTLSEPERRRPPSPRSEPALGSGYHSPQVDVEVRLNTNESPEPPPAALLDELASAARALTANRYPDRDARELRSAIAAHHGLDAARVFAANGSNEVLQCLLLAYGGPGRSALVFEPTYALHGHLARLTSTEVVTAERDEKFRIDADVALGAIAASRPDVLFVCSPNNPTGQCEARETVEAVAAAAPGLVVVDEAYVQFASWSAVDLLAAHPNVAVVRTFSKTWALAALRIGYLLADPEIAAAAAGVALPYHLDALKQRGAVAALRYRGEMEERVARVVEQRARVAAALAELPVDIWPSDANFVLFRPHRRPAAEVWQRLVDRSVLVRDVSGLARLEGCLRVTIGTAEDNDRFLSALAEVLASEPSLGSPR